MVGFDFPILVEADQQIPVIHPVCSGRKADLRGGCHGRCQKDRVIDTIGVYGYNSESNNYTETF